VNNAEWLAQFDLLGFLRDTGKYFHGQLPAAEGVGQTAGSKAKRGISYTEFSYLLLQARDFVELFDRYKTSTTLQMGRHRSVGQTITAGNRFDSQAARDEGARSGVGRLMDDGIGHEVREDGSRHDSGSTPAADVAVQVLYQFLVETPTTAT